MVELRRRLTIAAAGLLFVVLAATAAGLVVAQREALGDGLDDGLRRRAGDVASLVANGDLPTEFGTTDDDDAVQVVDADGRVLAATSGLRGEGPLVSPPAGREELRTVELPAVDDDPVRLLSRRLDGGVVIHVAINGDDIDEGIAALVGSLLVGIPVLTAALTAGVWWLVGRTLRPVEASARRQERFVADAAHELRSPLTRMRTELEVDLAHPSGADPRRTHESVLEEVVGLQSLVDDLLHLARSDAGARRAQREPVDVAEVARRHAERVHAALSVNGPAVVAADPDSIDRVMANLVDNAARHAASRVVVSVSPGVGEVVIEVTDDGPGIPAAEHERIFERFTRLDTSRTAATGGTGLGLAIARDVVEAHGGTITVDPDHTPGARFVVRLPTAT